MYTVVALITALDHPAERYEATRETAMDASEQICTLYAAAHNMDEGDAGDVLAALEQRGALVETMFLNGVEVDAGNHL